MTNFPHLSTSDLIIIMSLSFVLGLFSALIAGALIALSRISKKKKEVTKWNSKQPKKS